MSKHFIISPSQNLIHAVVEQLPSDTKDFSRSIVVFPGKRPAHFVRKALAERTRGSFIPPRTFSIDSFIEYVVTEKLLIHRRALGTLDAAALLFEIHKNIEQRLGGDHFDRIDRFVGVGLKLYDELEELVMADVRERALVEGLARVPLSRFHALPRYFTQFYTTVQDRGFTTQALMYRTVAEKISSVDFSAEHRIILAGFYAYTVLEQRIVSSLLRLENVTLIAQHGPGIGRRLESVGIDINSEEAPAPERTPVYRFYQSSDTHGQVFAMSQKLKERKDAGLPIDERTVIVLPSSDALFPVIHQTLPMLSQEEYNISLGYPLQRTPLYGFFNTLMDLAAGMSRGKVPTSHYTNFILHPYTKNILFGQRADISRVLFHSLELSLAEGRSTMFLSLEDLEGRDDLFEGVARSLGAGGTEISPLDLKNHLRDIHDRTIRKITAFSSVRDFAAIMTDILHYIHKQSTATRHPLFRPYAETFAGLLGSLADSLLAPYALTDVAAYRILFRNAVAAENVPFPGTPLRGLQVIGFLETRNISFETVYLLNATDDVIPGVRGHDVLLPQRLREQLGMETYSDTERREEYYFSTLLAGAKEVHCYFTESGKHEKSRFLEKLLWDIQKERQKLDLDDIVGVVRYKVRLSTSRPHAIAKTPDVVEHLRQYQYTATALDAYRTCPLKFYYAHVLRISEKDDVTEDVDEREIGIVVHKILKIMFDGSVGRLLGPQELDANRLRSVVDRFFADQYGTDLIGPAFLVKQQVEHQLEEFLTEYQAPKAAAGEIRILGLEEDFAVSCEGFRFAGRIDRIEQRGDRYVILDYKTGANDQRMKINLSKLIDDDADSWRDAVGSFQLVMYMLLYSASRGILPDQITPSYLFLGRNTISPQIEVPLGGGKDPAADVYARVRPIMIRVIQEIVHNETPFEPAKNLQVACPRCPYTTLCGTTWVTGRPD